MNECVIIGCTDRADVCMDTPHDSRLWYCDRHGRYMRTSTGKKDGYEVVRRA